jgi:hypothetical protein
MADWICPNCQRRIHSLDGAISTNGEGFRHFDCEQAAGIDYAAAFDRLYEAVLDIGYTSHALMEETTGMFEEGSEVERLVVSLWVQPGDAKDHHWLKTGERRELVATREKQLED